MKDLTDTEFDFRVELILKNDKNGLREIYQCYGKVIYNIMLDIVKSPQDAEEIVSKWTSQKINHPSKITRGLYYRGIQ